MKIDSEDIIQRRKKIDSRSVYESVMMLPQQVHHAWAESSVTQVPGHYTQATSIVLFGMGGSALGMDIIRAVFEDTLQLPIQIVSGYTIPAYVNENTLVVLSSYSGTTEEVLTVAKTIVDRTKKILVLTTGGELSVLAQQHAWPMYNINPTHNPCGQPRIAVGYTIVGLIGLLRQAGVVDITSQVMDDVAHYLEGNAALLEDEAWQAVEAMASKAPLFIGSEFLAGNMHTVANQVNENGKNFAAPFYLPELNHHLLEGLSFPSLTTQYLHCIFVESNLYHERNQRRYSITKEILDKQHISYSTFIPTATTKLQQSFEVLQWGGFLSFYVAMVNQVDPSPIPWVDHLKQALA